MNTPDPASLLNLNDIVLPETVGWWPLAAGWYFLFGLLLMVMAWLIYVSIKHWFDNSYRREALQHLQLLTEDIKNTDKREHALSQLPVLLKRTALSVYPRSQLASLTGEAWHAFLNSKVSQACFTDSDCTTLDEIAYSAAALDALDRGTTDNLLKACRHWLKHHRASQQERET